MSFSSLYSNDVFRHFAWWSAAMSVKMLCMAPLIGKERFTKKIFISPEDIAFVGKNARVVHDDPDVERPRRAFLNDLENILPWFICTSIFLTTSPQPQLAKNLITAFGFSRILHTIVYAVIPVPQPARAIAFGMGYAITWYQAYLTLVHYA